MQSLATDTTRALMPRAEPTIKNEPLSQLREVSPQFVNVEKTVKADVGEITILHPDIDSAVIEDGMRFIVLDAQLQASVSEGSYQEYELRTSPLECGRVFESDFKILIDGVPYTVLTKGGGATHFYRATGAETKYMSPIELSRGNAHDPSLYAKVPYHSDRGLFDIRDMQHEVDASQILQTLGIRTQKNIAWAPLLKIPDEYCSATDLEDLKKQGHIHPELEPVLLIRALRSNFRLMDFVNFFDRNEPEGTIWLIDQTKDLHRDAVGKKMSTQRLYTKIMKQLVDDTLTMCFAGYSPAIDFADDLARNITIAGEWLDMDDLYQPEVRSPYCIQQNFTKQCKLLLGVASMVAGSLNAVSPKPVNMDEFAVHLISSLRMQLKSGKSDPLYEKLSASWKKNTSSNDLRYEIFKGCLEYFTDTSFFGRFAKIQNSASKAVKDYLESLKV